MRLKEGKAEALRATLLSLFKPTQEEPGCIIYNIYEGTDGAFLLYEAWRSQADFEAHIQKPYIRDFLSKKPDLLDGANDAHFGKLISDFRWIPKVTCIKTAPPRPPSTSLRSQGRKGQ